MRNVRRVLVSVVLAAAFAAPAAAQTSDRISLNAAIGPSFGNVGTTFSSTAGLDVALTDRATIVGEFGILPRAPFHEAAEIAAPVAAANDARVNALHWNGNLKVRPFDIWRFQPYVTGGFGAFASDTIVDDVMVGATRFEDRRRTTDFASNLGAGFSYRLTDWAGIGADYRTFFVHRDGATPRVHRFTTGFTLSLK